MGIFITIYITGVIAAMLLAAMEIKTKMFIEERKKTTLYDIITSNIFHKELGILALGSWIIVLIMMSVDD